MVLVISSIRSRLSFRTAESAKESCLAKVSKLVWDLEFSKFLNSSYKLLFLVISAIFWMNKQKYKQIFSLKPLLSLGSQSSKFKLAISVKHLIASFLVEAGCKKLLIMIGMSSVSKMKPYGIHEVKAWKVLRQALTRVGLIVWGDATAYSRTHIHSSKIVAKSLFIDCLSCLTWVWRRAFLPKSKTSSERSLRMFKVFSHLLWVSLALEQISGTKLCHDVNHSCFTIEIKVALSLVKRWEFLVASSSSSESLITSWTMKARMPCFWSSGRIFHLV